MKKWIALILALVMAAGMLVGCSQEETADTSTEGASSEGSTAEDAYSVSGNITLGTASSTGTFYYVGAAIGNAVTEAGQLNVLVQATAGSNENVAMAQSGDIDIGMANSDALYAAYNGIMGYEEAGKQDI